MYAVYTVRVEEDAVDDVEGRFGIIGVVGAEKIILSAVWFLCLCLPLRVQVRPRVKKLLVDLEWRSGVDRVGGGERGECGERGEAEGEPERSSVLGEKREEWDSDVRRMGGRDSLRDLPRPRALVYNSKDIDIDIDRGKLGDPFSEAMVPKKD